MESPEAITRVSSRQLRLLTLDTSLSLRLGAAFFRAIPGVPGVYWFYDSSNVLLYIGQSCNLHARIGSYRHVTPEQHPKRILRLVHRVARIEWRACAHPEEAIELERVLLLEHRPPFNRAGVWEGLPWWLTAAGASGRLAVELTRQPTNHCMCTGPLPSSFRYVHAAMMRCAYRLTYPLRPLADFPLGMLNHTIPLSLAWPADAAPDVAALLTRFAAGDSTAFLARLAEGMPPAGHAGADEYWLEQLDTLQRFARKRRQPNSDRLWQPVAALPLFPSL